MGIEELFGNLFGGGRRRGRDVQAQVELSLEEVARGAQRTLDMERLAACSTCRGSGAAPGTQRRTCASCRGSGLQRVQRGGLGFQFVSTAPCPTCRGQGSVVEQACAACRGEGRVRKRAEVELDIPPGVEDGQVLQVRGAGEAGPAGAPAGDLLVLLRVLPHARFERRGLDLLTSVQVPFHVAALGGAAELELLDGSAEKLHIAAGTPGGTVLTLDRKGLRDGHGRKGDLHVLLDISVPQKVSPRARELLGELAQELGEPAPRPDLKGKLKDAWDKLGKRE
jgi:molecular chaperone DnaJ